jgi:hypothetical protein
VGEMLGYFVCGGIVPIDDGADVSVRFVYFD